MVKKKKERKNAEEENLRKREIEKEKRPAKQKQGSLKRNKPRALHGCAIRYEYRSDHFNDFTAL